MWLSGPSNSRQGKARKYEWWGLMYTKTQVDEVSSVTTLKSIYSWPSLVVPYSEEPFSRPFLGENWFWIVLQKRMSTENAVGCLFFSHAHVCLQLQQNTMIPIDVDGQICHFCSQGFVPWQILVVFKRRNPIENITVNTIRTMVSCWSCKQSSGWSYANSFLKFLVLIRSWSSNRILYRPVNGQEMSSSVFCQTRRTRHNICQFFYTNAFSKF